jgi:fatty-acid desaturase
VKVLAGVVPPHVGRVEFSWSKAAWLWGHLAATAVFLPAAIDASLCAWALGFTYLTLCAGHSVGLHRGLIHRTYRTSRAVQRSLLALFVFTGLGGPLAWIRLHFVRDHWQRQGDCPPYFAYRHGIARDFGWNLHGRFEPDSWDRYGIDEAILRDGFLAFLDRTWWAWNLASYALLHALAGFDAAIVCGVARVSGGIVGHWFIGYWISFGEGFHNNHHALPDSARMGIEPWEFDLGWVTIRALERLHLVHDVKCWSRGNARLRGALA